MDENTCQCEHLRHFPEEWATTEKFLKGHKYLTGRSVGKRAEYVGPICNWCAEYCMSKFLV